MIALVIGYGSIGRRHCKILKKIKEIKKIFVLTKQKNIKFATISSIKDIIKINPDYIVVAKSTNQHYLYFNFLEKNFSKRIILIEKPIFEKFYKVKKPKNEIYVGYNLRYHPVIQFLKKKINKNFLFCRLICGSDLRSWRKNINYKHSSSAQKKHGGGVINDLSHELDFLNFLFGNIKFMNKYVKKLSNLKINTEDFAAISGTAKNLKYFDVSLNYFFKMPIRQILLSSNDETIIGDLINYSVLIKNKNKIITKKFKINYNQTYLDMHKAIINKKKKYLCNFKQAIKNLENLKKIKCL